MQKEQTCCFFGHRKIKETDELKIKLHNTVENLIVNHSVNTFLFGSKSEFDKLCHKIVTKLKEKYPQIQRVYVRAEYPHITESYKEYLLKEYEYTYYPEKLLGAGKAVYVERIQEMINDSKYCVVFYNKNYIPQRRKIGKKDLFDYQPRSGAAVAYDYAVKKNKEIINLYSHIFL